MIEDIVPYVPGWEYQPEKCPCDRDFISWMDNLEASSDEVGVVFHMGTGMHHMVGRDCNAQDIWCIGLTASLEEYEAGKYFANDKYTVIFSDIYKLVTGLIPELSILTLFHLGEMVGTFGEINVDAIDALIKRVKVGGKILFYMGSNGFANCHEYLARAKEIGLMQPHSIFETLLVYERT